MNRLLKTLGRVALAGLLACGLTAHAQNVKLRVGVPIVIDSAPFFAALDQGYFKADGLDIEVTTSPVSNPLLTQLAATQLDIAFSNIVTISQAIENGLDFKVVLPGTLMKKGNDVNPCVVAIDSPIRTAKDMEGKRLASPALNNIIWLYAREWLEKNGADISKVRIIEVPFPQMLDAVTTGQAEAVCPTEPFFTRAMESGKVRVLGFVYHETTDNLESVMGVARGTWLRDPANVAVLERFARAYRKGVAFMEQNKKGPEGVRIISAFTKMDPAVVAKIQTPVFPMTVNTKTVEEMARLMAKHGLLKKPADVNGFMFRTATSAN
jgi:NitT/TauT family transport system substrate-binding protein